jgi:peptide/nickel transport system substrate-binding protein
MLPMHTRRLARLVMALAAAAAAACTGADRVRGSRGSACADCGTIVIAAAGEPSALLPPLAIETIGRDVGDLIYERLADLAPGGAPVDTAAFRPGLASSWERIDSLSLRFHLRPGARWQDGQPLTAEDVVFSFDAYADSLVDAGARPYIAGRVTAVAEDSMTVRIQFTGPSPEQLYDATYHVRILPRHIWSAMPREAWAADTATAHLVGSGPYRLRSWEHSRSLTLIADTARTAPAAVPAIRRVIWRFAPDPDAALNLILTHEADLLEQIGAPDRVSRVAADSAFRLLSYPSAVFGFLAFRLADAAGHPHPVLGDRAVRRALTLATDRALLARSILGPSTRVPSGPMSQLLWISRGDTTPAAADTAAAARLLDSAGWVRPAGGVRQRMGQRLHLDLLVPSTSATRRNIAVALQEAWRRLGADVSVTVVDGPVFQQRLGAGRFDAYVGAYLDEPSARGLADQWTRAGWGGLNYGRYGSVAFDSLLARAGREGDRARSAALYREAMDTINADAPAIFLYALTNTAAVHRRLRNVTIDPFSWLATLPQWSVEPGARLPRDSIR